MLEDITAFCFDVSQSKRYLWCLIRVALPPLHLFLHLALLSFETGTPICSTLILPLSFHKEKKQHTTTFVSPWVYQGDPPPPLARWKAPHQPRGTSKGRRFRKAVRDKWNRSEAFLWCRALFTGGGGNPWPRSPFCYQQQLITSRMVAWGHGTPQHPSFFSFHFTWSTKLIWALFTTAKETEPPEKDVKATGETRRDFPSLSSQTPSWHSTSVRARALLKPVSRWDSCTQDTKATSQIQPPN